MSLIKNLIKEPEKSKGEKKKNESEEEQKPRPIIKSALDLQRLKLEKLMKNPEKIVVIPEHRREKDYMQGVPSFVRNVMGSSAGAGSGEFHVYRHLRRKEYARQKMIQHKSIQEQLDDDFQQKLEDNLKMSEDKTAKKRAKRLKKKQRAKKPKQNKPANEDNNNEDSSEESAEDDSVQEQNYQTDNPAAHLVADVVNTDGSAGNFEDEQETTINNLSVGIKTSNEDETVDITTSNEDETVETVDIKTPNEDENGDIKTSNEDEAVDIKTSNEDATVEQQSVSEVNSVASS